MIAQPWTPDEVASIDAGPSIVLATDLMARIFPEARTVIPGAVPEGLSILAARPKIGKSWMALGWSVAVASGGHAFGCIPVIQGDALYLALEDNQRRLQSRLATILDYGEEPPARLHLATEWPRLDVGGIDALGDWLAGHSDARIVVIDTLARIRPRSKRREGSGYEEDYNDVAALKALADRYRVAVVVIHHLRKMTATDPLDMVSGTLGLSGAADAVLVLQRSRGAADATLHVSGRDIEEATHSLDWSAAAGTWSVVDLILPDVSAERAEILRYLQSAGRPMTPSYVATALSRPVGTIKRLMWSMSRDGQIEGGGRDGYLWANPANPENHANSRHPEPIAPGSPGSPGSLGSIGSIGSPSWPVDDDDPPSAWDEVMT